jgi:hypothetical protein
MSDEISCDHQIKDSETIGETNRQQSVASCEEKTKDLITGGKLFTVISGTYL